MAILRAKEIAKMNRDDIKEKIKELKIELIKANVVSRKQNAKTKEIKKTISRLNTYLTIQKNKNNQKMFNLSTEKLKKK